ncbi:MAG: alpha/beta hydrolase [Chloroflexota bacterium]
MKQPHPEMQKLADAFDLLLKASGLTEFRQDDPNLTRNALKDTVMPADLLPPIHRVDSREIPGPNGQIPIRIYYPSDETNLPVLIWFHGGGWVLGSLDSGEANCRTLAKAVGCVVVAPDYRLAPETRFPGAIDDCFATTEWVANNGAELGVDTTRIAVAGDSAGGNLAACVAYLARENSLKLVHQLLVYPVIDADFDRPSYLENAEGYLLTRSDMQWFWDCYVPNLTDRQDVRVAPIYADDLSGLPPAHIMTAELDPLRDEGEAYGEALRGAGVPVTIHRYEGMIHAFFNYVSNPPVDAVVTATNRAVADLRQAFELE